MLTATEDVDPALEGPAIVTPSGTAGVPVTAGSTYSVSAMVVDAAYDGSLESVAALTWYDAEGRDIGRTPGEWTSSAEEWFTEVSAEAVAPAGAAFVGISIAFPGTESGRRRLVDDVVLAEVVEGGGAPNLLTPWASTFEGDDLGWGAGRASIGRSADRKPPGDDNYVSLEVTLDERAALDGGVVYANPGLDGMEVVPGETYTGRFLVNAQEGISEVTGVVIFFDADGVPMTNDYGEGLDVESSSVEWAEISVPAVAPPGAASASVGALFEGDPGASAYIDLVEFFAGSSGVGPNQMPAAASTFEGGASPGWISDGGAVARSADEARQGTVSLRVGEGVGRLESAAITEFGTNGIPVAPGRSYTASGWIRPQGDDPAQAVVMIAFFDAAGRMVAMQEPAPDELVAEVVGDWVQMSTTRPSPGNAAFATLAFFVEGTGIAQGVHYIDDVAFCLGTSPDCVGDGRPTLVPTDVHAGGVDLATETTDVAWAADDELVVAEGVTGFRIEWDGGHLEVEDPSARSATVGGLDPEVEHTFTVAARNDVGLGSPSVPSEPTTAQGPPTVAPSGLVARPSGVPGRMDLTWSRFPMSGWHGNSDGGFEVEWDGGATTASATATRTSVSGLDPETSLAFRIRAVNALGDGPWSAWSRPATAGDQPPLPNLFDDERSGFEPGAGWVGQGASVQRVDTVAHGGVVALEVRTETQEDSAAGAPSVLSGGAGPVPVTPGVDYLASVAVTPTSDGAERALAWLVWFDDAGDLLASDGGTAIDGMTQGTWSEVTAQGAAPEGAVSAAIRVSFPGDAGGHSYAIDDAVFAEVAVDPTPNLLAEGEASFELDPLGWSASYSSLARTGEAGAVDGVVSLRVDIDERADEEHVAGLSLDPARSGAAVVAGTQYSAQVRALAQGSSISAVASITFVDAAGVALARTDGAPAVVASESEWATAGVSAVAPAGAVRMIVGLAFPGAGADDFVWVDAVTLVRGSLLAPTSVNRLDETASSFEHAPLGWLSQGGAVGRSADDARQGLVSLRVGSTGFDDTIAYTEFGTHGIPVDGSRAYTASVWVKPQVGSERALAHIAYFDADGEMVAGSESDEDRVVWEIPDDWVQVTHTQVAPPDAAYAAIGLEVAGEGGAGVHYLDDASLCLGVSPDCLPDQPPVVIPSDLDAEREDAVSGVRLSWNQSSRPEDDVTGYRVEWDGGSEDVSGAETTELVIPDVVTESRTYTVRALNDRGVGLPSDPVMWDPAALVPTQAPTSVVATATGRSGQVRLSWAALPEGSDVVTGYVVTWDGGRRVVGSDRTRLVVSGLVDGETYELRVTARNGAGLGPESAPASAVPGVALTAAPTEVTAEQTAGGTIHVTWSGLAGETPTGYVVRWGTSPSSKAEVGPEVRELDIPGLAMGQLYTITVAGRNAFGSGPSSAGVEVRILAPPTAAPTGVRVFPGAVPGTAHVEWNPLSLVRWGGAVGSMIVSWPGGATSVDGAITQVTVQGIDPGEPVTFELFARNDLGDGPTATSRAVRLEGRTPYPNLFDEGSAGAEEPAAMGWVGHEATITSLTQSASTGVSSLGVLPTAVGGGARSPRVRAPAPGATVEASAHALGDRVMAAAQLVWFDAAGHVLAGGPTGTPVPLSISSWLSVEVSGVVPATATHVALDVVAVGQPSAIQIDTARIARETAGDPGLNLLSEADQDFEAVTIGWTGEGATTQRSFEEAHQSDAALRIEAVPDAPEEELGPAAVLSIPGSADLAGTSVTASAWLRDGEDGPTGARVGLATVHETGGSVFWSPRIVGPSWGHVEIQAEIPAGTERVFLVVELERGAGTVAFADDLEVVRDADPGRSLLPALQADLERAPFSWVAMGGYVGRAIDSTRDGEVSFRTTGIGGETFIVSDWASGGVPVDPGEVYTAGAWVRPETTPRGLTAQIVWFGVDGLPIDFTLPAIFTASEIADDWVQVANTGTAPEGARTASLLLAWHGASAGRVSHIDQASFCQGADVDCIPSGDPISTVRNVTAAATSSSGELSVRWNPLAAARVTAEGVDGYRVSWPGGTVDVAGAAADGVVVDGLVDGEPVVFEVRTLAGSATGPPASSRTPIAPGSPVGIVHGLRSVVDGDDVVLSWDPVDAAVEGGVAPVSAIVVHRSDDEAEGAVLSDDAVGYTLEDLRRGTSVVVTVRLRNAHGDAGRSRRLSITVPATTPEASPSGLQGYADGERIHLEWDQVADDGGSPITAYEIDYSGWSQTVDAYDLVPGERVRGIVWSTNATEIVKVRGVNAHGTGPWSDSIEIATGTTPATPGPDLVDPSAPGSVVEWLSTGADVWVSAGGGRDGGRGLAVQPDGDDAVVATPTGTDGVVVPPGTERLALGAQVRGPSTAEARVDARWYDSVGRRIASADGAFVPLGTDWTEVAIDAEVPSGAAHVSLVVVFVGANGSPVHVDDATVMAEGSTTELLDGALTGLEQAPWAIVGARGGRVARAGGGGMHLEGTAPSIAMASRPVPATEGAWRLCADVRSDRSAVATATVRWVSDVGTPLETDVGPTTTIGSAAQPVCVDAEVEGDDLSAVLEIGVQASTAPVVDVTGIDFEHIAHPEEVLPADVASLEPGGELQGEGRPARRTPDGYADDGAAEVRSASGTHSLTTSMGHPAVVTPGSPYTGGAWVLPDLGTSASLVARVHWTDAEGDPVGVSRLATVAPTIQWSMVAGTAIAPPQAAFARITIEVEGGPVRADDPFLCTGVSTSCVGAGPPAPPVDVVTDLQGDDDGEGGAVLTWTAPDEDGVHEGEEITGYRVGRGWNETYVPAVPGAEQGTTIADLDIGEHSFTVAAVNAYGDGPPSEPLTVAIGPASADLIGAPGDPSIDGGWDGVDATVQRTAVAQHSGRYALEVTAVAPDRGGAGATIPLGEVPTGASITSAWVATSSGNEQVQLWAEWFDAEGDLAVESLVATVNATTTWKVLTRNRWTAPAGATRGRLVVACTTCAPGESVFVDDVDVTGSSLAGAGATTTFEPEADPIRHGTGATLSLAAHPGGGDAVLAAHLRATSATVGVELPVTAPASGTTVTASVPVRSVGAGTQARLRARWLDASGAELAAVDGTEVAVGAEDVDLVAVTTVPADGARLALDVLVTGTVGTIVEVGSARAATADDAWSVTTALDDDDSVRWLSAPGSGVVAAMADPGDPAVGPVALPRAGVATASTAQGLAGIPVSPGVPLGAVVSVRTPPGGSGVTGHVELVWFDEAGDALGTTVGTTGAIGSDPVALSVRCGAPADAATAAIRVVGSARLAIARAWVDHREEETDCDGDGITDFAEAVNGTNPASDDSDGDGVTDRNELLTLGEQDPLDPVTDGSATPDGERDHDGDGLDALEEQAAGSSPVAGDTDADGIGDAVEVGDGSDPDQSDSDADGVDDVDEVAAGTSPTSADSDGDGAPDDVDVAAREYGLDAGAAVTVTGAGATLAQLRPALVTNHLATARGLVAEPVRFQVNEDVAVPQVHETVLPQRSGTPSSGALLVRRFEPSTGKWVPLAPEEATATRVGGGISIQAGGTGIFGAFDVALTELQWGLPDLGQSCGGREGTDLVFLDVGFTIDSSGSMSWNDVDNVRLHATNAIASHLHPDDRAAVVDFDSQAIVRQGLTHDMQLVKDALEQVDASGGTNIEAGVGAALDVLAGATDPDRAQAIVLFTDGQGAWSDAMLQQVIDANVRVFTISLGDDIDEVLLRRIANETLGVYTHADDSTDIEPAFDFIRDHLLDTQRDSDKDGVSDCEEVNGSRDANGEPFTSEPDDPDSDNDGLTDGQEVGQKIFRRQESPGSIGWYRPVFSDPMEGDSDGDLLLDPTERDEGTEARDIDTDIDGLWDGEERTAGTSPFGDDTDGDGHIDAFEWRGERLGFSPVYEDHHVSQAQWLDDFYFGFQDDDNQWGIHSWSASAMFELRTRHSMADHLCPDREPTMPPEDELNSGEECVGDVAGRFQCAKRTLNELRAEAGLNGVTFGEVVGDSYTPWTQVGPIEPPLLPIGAGSCTMFPRVRLTTVRDYIENTIAQDRDWTRATVAAVSRSTRARTGTSNATNPVPAGEWDASVFNLVADHAGTAPGFRTQARMEGGTADYLLIAGFSYAGIDRLAEGRASLPVVAEAVFYGRPEHHRYTYQFFADSPSGHRRLASHKGEDYVRHFLYPPFPPASGPIKHHVFDGGRPDRIPDHVQGRLMFEVKVGVATGASRIRSEVQRDVEIREREPLDPVWLFFGSLTPGTLGPNRPLQDLLYAQNIPWVVHPV
ncbi:MAG TPA: fibronectin type III domain-containing protein [Iamia sp.]